jgi:hypothetical protein
MMEMKEMTLKELLTIAIVSCHPNAPHDVTTIEIRTEILTRFADLQAELEKWKALPKRCICGHYHCPICGNQTTLDVSFEAEVDRLTAELAAVSKELEVRTESHKSSCA